MRRIIIDGIDTGYDVCSNGDVYKGSYLMTPFEITSKSGKKYLRVSLSISKGVRKKYLVSRLVCMFFNEGYNDNLVCDHINGEDTLNNNNSNLEWVTQLENVKRSILKGQRKVNLSQEDVRYIRTSNLKQKDLSVMFGTDQGTISKIRSGKMYAFFN